MRLTASERAANGRNVRATMPRSSHATVPTTAKRVDPFELLRRQEDVRVASLVDLRHQRMLESPFAFFRGAAAVMAADLATTADSGLRVQCCGDAHLLNFGGCASPDRNLVFDVNDFDETGPGPFEWDVKRLAASFEIAARTRSFTPREARAVTLRSARAYREAMTSFAARSNLDVWYARLDIAAIISRWRQEVSAAHAKRFDEMTAAAHSKDSTNALAKLARVVDGRLRIISNPPLVVPIDELMAQRDSRVDEAHYRSRLTRAIDAYRGSLPHDRQRLIETYEVVDFARKVVGVGSVGTRCWIALLLGRDDRDPLFLQVKEAEASVLEPYAGRSGYANHGQRVVEGQRLLQASSDILLGWTRATAPDGVEGDYYVRQLWDWKISADVETMNPQTMSIYAQMCGWTLARGHARTGDRIAIAAYLGSGDVFDRAIADFASGYADQNDQDFSAAARTWSPSPSPVTALA